MKLKKIERFFDFYIKKFFEYPLQRLDDQISKLQDNYLIPPFVYQTWENNLFGKTHYKQIVKFRKNNHDLTFLLFDKKKRDDYMIERWSDHEILKVYQKAKLGVMKSDIFRHCILYDQGGYYFDISKGTKVSLRSLHTESTEAIISNEPLECIIPPHNNLFKKLKHPHNNFLTWGLGFKKNHPIPKMMIEAISNDYKHYLGKIFSRPKLAVLSLTATGQFTKVVRDYILNHELNDDHLIQSGIYFNGEGIFSMKGCRVRHHTAPSYADLKDISVF
jgi:mannosyltransferase OCH1-like enzyme